MNSGPEKFVYMVACVCVYGGDMNVSFFIFPLSSVESIVSRVVFQEASCQCEVIY